MEQKDINFSPKRLKEDDNLKIINYSPKNSQKISLNGLEKKISKRIKYHRKNSRDNSCENTGNVLYVSNFPKKMNDSELKELFEKYGKVTKINLIKEPFSKENRGFGFITFDSLKEAKNAKNKLNHINLSGKEIKVEISKRSFPHKPTPGIYLGKKSDYNKYNRNSYYKRNRSRSKSYDNNYYDKKDKFYYERRDKYHYERKNKHYYEKKDKYFYDSKDKFHERNTRNKSRESRKFS